ncbi:DUF1800 domain-containing protein [Agaribacter flavus]|uniref:DUF1800 family protein n=1 Tax=Agaribacter flavus TaxID=1902781 RepID=A0ABV7FS13_9ALTE
MHQLNKSKPALRLLGLLGLIFTLLACGGGGSDAPTPPVSPPPAPPAPEPIVDTTFSSTTKTARFLSQASFGPKYEEIIELTDSSASDWIIRQFELPIEPHLPRIADYKTRVANNEQNRFSSATTTFTFWKSAIEGEDQLRQRMVFALSQLLVVSSNGGDVLHDVPEAVGYYLDILNEHAFGNYRDLLEAISYSPAMANYLTYLGNEKGDPTTGRVPDENYARELLQLFSIGLLALEMDGTLATNSDNQVIELYDNEDITGLAKVFTGLHLDFARANRQDDFFTQRAKLYSIPLATYPENHSTSEKSFLGLNIPPNTDVTRSIDMALDHIMSQASVAPFISRQLIQRFTTSHPQPEYVERVARAFEQGQFTLPDGRTVGERRKGDLKATIAAILFDPNARDENLPTATANSFGKIREPVIRFAHWARAFKVENVTPEFTIPLWYTSGSGALGQHPIRPRSVFNFYRPGYIAPNSITGDQALTVPELQIMNASTIPGFSNFMAWFVTGGHADLDDDELAEIQQEYDQDQVDLDARNALDSFVADYTDEIALAEDLPALLERLDLVLTNNQMSAETKQHIIDTVSLLPIENDGAELRVMFAIIMTLTSPDYIVQT